MTEIDWDVQEAAKLLHSRLIARTDAFGLQKPDGSYKRVTEPMKMGHLIRHVLGEQSIGHYLIEPVSNTTKVFAFDIDADKEHEDIDPETGKKRHNPARDMALAFDPDIWTRMLSLAHGLASWARTWYDVRAMVSFGGGKGLHVICAVRKRMSAEAAGLAAQTILSDGGFEVFRGDIFWKSEAWPDLTVEVFPKQQSVEADGFGNLMRLPLGTNAKTGNMSYFIPAEVMSLGTIDDGLAVLMEGTWRD